MIDLLRARIPKSLEQIEEALQSDPEKLFSSGRCLCEIKAALIQVQKKIIRMLKSNLEREASSFLYRRRHLSLRPLQAGFGEGVVLAFSHRLHRLIAAYVATSSESQTVFSVCLRSFS